MAPLEPEQQELLSELVEAHRRVPRAQRGAFILMEGLSFTHVFHGGLPGWRLMSNRADVEMLARYQLVSLDYSGRPLRFAVTPEGLEYYDGLKSERSGRVEQVAEEIRQYVDGESFQRRHPGAFAKWAAADQDLWSSESTQQLTKIGHSIREAMQEFASELVELYAARNADDDRAHDVARVRAVLKAAGDRISGTVAAFIDTLVAYWGTVSDLAQRQEHDAQREGETLTWEDARRLVFQSAIVMYEVDRVLSRTASD